MSFIQRKKSQVSDQTKVRRLKIILAAAAAAAAFIFLVPTNVRRTPDEAQTQERIMDLTLDSLLAASGFTDYTVLTKEDVEQSLRQSLSPLQQHIDSLESRLMFISTLYDPTARQPAAAALEEEIDSARKELTLRQPDTMRVFTRRIRIECPQGRFTLFQRLDEGAATTSAEHIRRTADVPAPGRGRRMTERKTNE